MHNSLTPGFRRTVILSLAAGLLTMHCERERAIAPSSSEEAKPPEVLRVTEARLTGFGVWHQCTAVARKDALIASVSCGAATIPPDLVSIPDGGCNRPMKTMTDAVRQLAYVPACTDKAIAKLESLALPNRDAAALSNLSAAYYVRAQRTDQPADIVRALDAALVATELAPSMPEAVFNRALVEEALGFVPDAIASWDSLRKSPIDDGWAKEAGSHWARLTKEQTIARAMAWPLHEQRLPELARAHDRNAIRLLIQPYQDAAQRLVEETILTEWAKAALTGDEKTANDRLVIAAEIAAAHQELAHDNYLLDAVNVARNTTDPAKRAALIRGHIAFSEGRVIERTFQANAAEKFVRAEGQLAIAGSPVRLKAMIVRASSLLVSGKSDEATALLKRVAREAEHRHYKTLLGRVHAGYGLAATLQSRWLDALVSYSKAESFFEDAQDNENVTNALSRKIGVLRFIGNHSLTWREVFRARSGARALADPQSRHFFLGESALCALELGYPRVALRYQNSAVTLLENELAAHGNDEALVPRLRGNLSIALRGRAAIHAHLGNNKDAEEDLRGAFHRIEADMPLEDASILNGFRARLSEVRAQTLAPSDRQAAIGALTQGIGFASKTHFRSMRASLLVQRARLYRLAHERDKELIDLRNALDELQQEEMAAVTSSAAKKGALPTEKMWSSYFARYQDSYRQVIQALIENGDDRSAFDYAERARAFEPLHLILSRNDVPVDFRRRIHNGKPFSIGDVEEILPANTFLLQYSVLEEHTYVWIVWNGDFVRTTLPIGNEAIGRWTTALQQFAFHRDAESFAAALNAPYDALLREPLARVAKLRKRGTVPKVVIVPDRMMHGLPFSALRDGTRHVVQDFSVSVEASATLYAYSKALNDARTSMQPQSALLVADPAFDPALELTQKLDRLPFARDEASRIAALYESELDVHPLPDTDATIPEFLRLAHDSAIVHIAAHGVANPDTPSSSFLLFAPDEQNTGVLEAVRLLQDLRLTQARLVVVAACSSAAGTPVGPEGVAPIVRPLIAAGAPGVVGTLWNVSENPATAELLIRFHRHYRDGMDADDALRQAQRDMLEDPDLARSSVIVWAPFQFIGFASSPFAKDTRR